MKWLFAVLVALNIIVFGGMVAHRMTGQPFDKGAAPLEGGRHELAQPDSLRPADSPDQENRAPDWVAAPEAQNDMAEPESEEAVAEREKREREARSAKEKKEREEKAKRDKERSEEAALTGSGYETGGVPGAALCQATASVSLDEDDYHRIKGLLNRWPHAASRSVEKRAAKQGEAAVSKTFRVLLPTGGDAIAQLDSLSGKGFTGVIYEGEISLGVTRSRSAAQILISRLSGAGFGGARILEEEEKGRTPDGTLSVSRMNVTFMAVDERAAQDIRNVVGRYGNLNVRPCK